MEHRGNSTETPRERGVGSVVVHVSPVMLFLFLIDASFSAYLSECFYVDSVSRVWGRWSAYSPVVFVTSKYIYILKTPYVGRSCSHFEL